MFLPKTSTRRTLLTIVLLSCLAAPFSTLRGQESAQPTPSGQDDDVIRIKTELVQTDLMVFDKQGRFVDGLRPEQFELTVDGKPQVISFFERVTAGSADEASQVRAAARGTTSSVSGGRGSREVAGEVSKGRLIFFFLDDLHLSESSLARARKALSNFIENRMNESDQVAIVSTSGQIGFLQQLTDNKTVLTEAVSRLNYRRVTEIQGGKVPISENDANQIQNGTDRDLFAYLVRATQNEYFAKGDGAGRTIANLVRNRVRQINIQSKADAATTFDVLQSLMRSSASLPGRKLVVFMSDGFIVDPRRSNALDLMKRVTDDAARSGVVVYTMDLRGTFADAAVDASRNDYSDLGSPRVARNIFQEATATQEPMRILADDTGGRAIL
ncbi:MAG TPA: VWA domain-containing protein, partial [Pyrinomonadaceae bacterium]|nr:VWA domain-containing protein [Pyrinomonadaceae bacterium]